MWMLPQMLSTRSLATPDEFGSRPMPVNEEEENKHLDLYKSLITGQEAGCWRKGDHALGHCEEHPVVAAHSEVPHPPPWELV
jgi:hypothetical protein